MFVNHLDVSGDNRLKQILHTLKHVHGFEFNEVDTNSLHETARTFEQLKNQIVEASSFNSYYKDPNYTKAALITEAVRMLLEISPKRKKKATVESTESNKDTSMKKLSEKSSAPKPDFLDVDKDGNKTEPMKKALRDKAHKGKKNLKEEQNLDQAETLLAAKDISDQLQNMAEDAAKMSVDDLMPLVDTMKAQFGQEQANAFNEVVKQNLQAVLDGIIKAKDETDNAIMALQGGQTPAPMADISQPLPGAEAPVEPNADAGADGDFEKDFAATPSASGPETEPLGRASKREVSEAWDTKMKTAKKDIGKWEGYSIAELKARKKKLMDKAERSAAEQKEVRQINFAIRAKQPDHWGKIKEADDSNTAKLAMMAVTGKDDKGKVLTSQQKIAAKKAADELTKAKIEEKLTKKMSAGEIISDFVKSDDAKFKGKSKSERTKMALGAYYGMHPEKSKQEESQIVKCAQLMEALEHRLTILHKQFTAHKRDFQQQLSEGKQIDPLELGYGLIGDTLRHKIRETTRKLKEATLLQNSMLQRLTEQMNKIQETSLEIKHLDKQLGSNPYGVVAITNSGKKTSKFFESDEQRSIWLEFHKDTLNEHQLINPDNISKAQNYLKRKIAR